MEYVYCYVLAILWGLYLGCTTADRSELISAAQIPIWSWSSYQSIGFEMAGAEVIDRTEFMIVAFAP